MRALQFALGYTLVRYSSNGDHGITEFEGLEKYPNWLVSDCWRLVAVAG